VRRGPSDKSPCLSVRCANGEVEVVIGASAVKALKWFAVLAATATAHVENVQPNFVAFFRLLFHLHPP
jgi:hypothetical protein